MNSVPVIKVFVEIDHLVSVENNLIIYYDDNNHKYSIRSSVDHPSFQQTRDWLHNNGYIRKDTSCVNGDIVLNPFYLNTCFLNKNDRFPCSGYWGTYFKYRKREKINKIINKRKNKKPNV